MTTQEQTLSRNAPCPCGSGKKYKHCCLGKPIATSKIKVRLVVGLVAMAIIGGALTVSWYFGTRAGGFVGLIGAAALIGTLVLRRPPPAQGKGGADRIDFGR